MTAMNVIIHSNFRPHDDPVAFPASHSDTHGFEIRNDVAWGGRRCIAVGPAGQPGRPASGLPIRF
jgi:hypothetical protein